jgi:predicted transcriptional regulator
VSIKVFRDFLVHDADGTIDATGVVSQPCFDRWSANRAGPTVAKFRRAVRVLICLEYRVVSCDVLMPEVTYVLSLDINHLSLI